MRWHVVLELFRSLTQSTGWYASHGKDEKARESMRQVRGPTWPEEEIDAEVDEIVGMIKIERQLEGAASWKQCFQGTDLRRTLLAMGALLSQEFSGVAFIAGSVSQPMLSTHSRTWTS